MNNPEDEKKQSSSGIDTLIQAETWMQIAILLPCAALIGWFFGTWLDGKLHQHWIGVTGLTLGGLAGIVHVVRIVIISGKTKLKP
jgi:F0F1-type ATP synthase assembly protein I